MCVCVCVCVGGGGGGVCGCLRFCSVYLKAVINKILSPFVDVGHIDRTT